MTKTELHQLRRSQVEAYQNSGLSAASWCSKNNIKISTFHYWLKKAKVENNTAAEQEEQWMQITPARLKAIGSPSPITIKIDSVTIEVQSDFDRGAFEDVLAAIRSIC